jgi:hypothetical protein
MAQRQDFRTNRPATPGQGRSRNDPGGELEERSGAGMDRDPSRQRDHETTDDQRGAYSVDQLVARYPYVSLMTGFGFGLGFGLVVTLLLTRREPTWFERYVPEPIQHFPDRLKRVPETLTSYFPGSWKHS